MSYDEVWDEFLEKQAHIAEETKKAQAYTQLMIDVYKYFNCSGPITKEQIRIFKSQQEKDITMDNIENTKELTLEEVLAINPDLKLDETKIVEFKQDDDTADAVVI